MGIFDFLKKDKAEPARPHSNRTSSFADRVQQQNQSVEEQQRMQTSQAAQKHDEMRDSYTVQSGDSLSKIAQHYYGDAQKWKAIYEANKDKIDNPNLIHPGQKLTIPKQ